MQKKRQDIQKFICRLTGLMMVSSYACTKIPLPLLQSWGKFGRMLENEPSSMGHLAAYML
jgi:hypothetical protein